MSIKYGVGENLFGTCACIGFIIYIAICFFTGEAYIYVCTVKESKNPKAFAIVIIIYSLLAVYFVRCIIKNYITTIW
jgi:hypothetical protein